MNRISLLLIACMALTVTGCKLDIMVPPGGIVESESGERDCDGGIAGKYCTFDLTTVNLPFSETFTASAKPGYQFVEWKKASGFRCGDSVSATCALTIDDSEFSRTALASFQTIYLMPVFRYLGIDTDGDGTLDPHDADDDNDGLNDTEDNCPVAWPNDDGFGCPNPLPNSIVAEGKEWAQPITFINLTWEQVHDVCPTIHGLPLCTGQLNGVDLRGWRWATLSEVESFVRSYSGMQGGCEKLGADFSFGVSSTYGDPVVTGWVSDTSANKYLITGPTGIVPCFNIVVGAPVEVAATGSWFYRVLQ